MNLIRNQFDDYQATTINIGKSMVNMDICGCVAWFRGQDRGLYVKVEVETCRFTDTTAATVPRSRERNFPS